MAEARLYYAAHLAGIREVTCYAERVRLYFEADATHTFSESVKNQENIPDALRVTSQKPRFVEVRRFSLDRATHLDHILPAVSKFTVSTDAERGNRAL